MSKRNKLAPIILELKDKADKFQETLERVEEKVSEDNYSNIEELMDEYFSMTTDTVNLTVNEVMSEKMKELQELITSLVEQKSKLSDEEDLSASDQDRLNNIEELLKQLISKEGEVEEVNNKIDKENKYRDIKGESKLPEFTQSSRGLLEKVKGSATLASLKEGSQFAYREFSPMLSPILGPVGEVTMSMARGAGSLLSAVGSDISSLFSRGTKDKEIGVLEEIRDSLQESEYKFDESEKKKEKEQEEDSKGIADILNWTKGFSSFLPKLFKWGTPLALALGAYLLLRNDIEEIYDRLKETLTTATDDEKSEAEAIVESKLANNPNGTGVYSDETTGQEDVPILSKFNRSVGQVMTFVGSYLDKAFGFGDPDKTSRNPWMGYWNPFTWAGETINAAFGVTEDPNYDSWSSVMEPSKGFFDRVKSNVDYVAGEVVPVDVAMQGKSYLPGKQMGTKDAMTAAAIEDLRKNSNWEGSRTTYNPSITNRDVQNFLVGNNPNIGKPALPTIGPNLLQPKNVNTVISNNYNLINSDGRGSY